MQRFTLLIALLALAGCAGTTEKSAEATPAPAVAVTAERPAEVPPSGTPASTEALPAPPAPAVVAETQAASAAPVQVAKYEAVQASGWDELRQRVLAWGNPMRRSMEQYCPPESTTSKP